ncbi:MAG: dihydropteroate synthase [Verrucomicrobia bacterium]|nr:dihydropteroate synthase [Verrucomicrobiota bacterium]NBS05475.1 dihydropteroate synthase [Verrucomicrobiota bacterium]NBY37809.1 dihydropteroate synthase [Verrucomicrobiota bacterium]
MSWSSPHDRALPDWRARTLVMGIVNVTPDSFSDAGLAFSDQDALRQAEKLVAEGADLLDLGAESSRPGAEPIDAATELSRLLPALKLIRQRFPQLPLSVDTYKAAVARACLEAGADMINDIEGARYEADSNGSPMARVCAEWRCPLILMHRKALPAGETFWPELIADLRQSLALAQQAGIPPQQLWVDPGFGFGKSPTQNLLLVRNLEKIAALGFPVLLGTSRKSTLGLVLDRNDPSDRHEANVATAIWGIAQGCAMVRVHEVAKLRPYITVADALRHGPSWQPPAGVK